MTYQSVRLSVWMVPVLLVGLCPAATNAAQQMGTDKTANAPAQSITGCLQKGDEAGGFTLTGENGKVWQLHSATVRLADHVGHMVTVTGSSTLQSKEKEEDIEASEKKETAGKELADLQITGLKMISDSCK